MLIPKEFDDPVNLVQQKLEQNKIPASIDLVVPSIEDVFVAVTELQGKEALAA